MKILKVAVFALMVVPASVMVQAEPGEPVAARAIETAIAGTWESDKKDVRMEYFQEGGHYSARLLWGNLIVETDGVTSKKDTKNPDEKLRSRDILGIVSLTGLKWNGEQYAGGKIYDPPSGKTCGCKAWIEGDKLYMRGYLGLSPLGKTVSWHRYRTETAQEVALAVGDEATAVIKTSDDIVESARERPAWPPPGVGSPGECGPRKMTLACGDGWRGGTLVWCQRPPAPCAMERHGWSAIGFFPRRDRAYHGSPRPIRKTDYAFASSNPRRVPSALATLSGRAPADRGGGKSSDTRLRHRS